MIIDTTRLLLDFGLLILIWMVQTIVYPSLTYYDANNLIKWHKKYVSNFRYIVVPLMFGQLGVAIYQAMAVTNIYTFSSLIIIIFVWISTFFQFVPIHSDISKGNATKTMLKNLVCKNWIRTSLWSVVFIMSFIYYALYL